MGRAPTKPPLAGAIAVSLVLLLTFVSGCVGNDEPGRLQHHDTPLVLAATTVISGTGWTTPEAALMNGDALSAATSTDQAVLNLGLANSTFTGAITKVTLKVDQQQVNANGDTLRLYVYSATCGFSGATLPTTASRTTLSTDASCTLPWTWSAVNDLVVYVQSFKAGGVDGQWRVFHVWLEITITNNVPVANAGPDQSILENAGVTLTSAATSDADGIRDPLTYAWTQVSGTNVLLSGPTTASPTFTAPTLATNTPTQLVFQVTVTDPNEDASADTVTITVTNVNQVPSADAGPDQTVLEGAPVTLTGLGSADADSDALTYAWTQTAGTSVTLSSATAAQPTFTAPTVPTQTALALTFSLTVNDGFVNSAANEVTITIDNINAAPSANAGPDQAVDEATTVTLSAAATDDDSDTVTYAWTQTSGTTVTLSSATEAAPTFTAPTLPTNTPTALQFQLVVSDGLTVSAADSVTITVNNVNQAPVANAGTDQVVQEGADVTLDASGSIDPDTDTLTLAWTQTGGPAVTLTGPTGLAPTFTAPTLTTNDPVVVTFRATAADPSNANSTDTVTVTVENVNQAPIAIAGATQNVNEGATVQLTGTASNDAEGDSLTYAWTQTGGPTVTLTGPTTATPSFTAPTLSTNAAAVVTFELIVNDGSLSSSADTITINVANVNQAPTAAAGADQNVLEGASVQLSGATSSDPDSDTLTFAWVQTSGPTVVLSGSNQAAASFTAPTLPTNTPAALVFSLVVSDGFTSSAADLVTIDVANVNQAPTVDAGTDVTGDEATLIVLEATSSDADDDTLTLAWTQTSGPAVVLDDASATSPTFTAPAVPTNSDVILGFQVSVSDGIAAAVTDDVTVTLQNVNQAPLASAGSAIVADEQTLVELQGTASDADTDSVTVAWTQVSGPTVTLTNATTLTPSFTAPALDNNTDVVFGFQLIANDGLAASQAANVVVTIQNVNAAPVADVGADQIVETGALVVLDGTLSSDEEGDLLSFSWTQTSGPTVTLLGATTDRPTFTAPSGPEELVFQLIVTDALGASSAGVSSTVNVNAPAAPPVTTAATTAQTGPTPTAVTETVTVTATVTETETATTTVTGPTATETITVTVTTTAPGPTVTNTATTTETAVTTATATTTATAPTVTTTETTTATPATVTTTATTTATPPTVTTTATTTATVTETVTTTVTAIPVTTTVTTTATTTTTVQGPATTTTATVPGPTTTATTTETATATTTASTTATTTETTTATTTETTTATTTATVSGPTDTTTATATTTETTTATATETIVAPTVTVPTTVTSIVQLGGGGGGGGVITTTVTTSTTNVVRLLAIPSSALVEEGERIPVAVVLIPPSGIASSAGTAATCVWDASAAGGVFEPGLTSCEGTFVADDTPGQTMELGVLVSVDGSPGFDLTIPIFKGLNAEPNADDATIHDVSLPPVIGGVRVPVWFPPGHVLERVLLFIEGDVASGSLFETRQLTTLPIAIPGALTEPAFVMEINLFEGPNTPTRVPVGASLQFGIEREWLDSQCPAVTCQVQLFHFDDGVWTPLETTQLQETDEEIQYSAPTPSFSLFAAAGVPRVLAAEPVAPDGAFPWIPVVAVIVAALLLSAAAAGVITIRKRREPVPVVKKRMGPGFGELVKSARHQDVVQFVNSAAHDLATPLTTLNIQLYLLVHGDPEKLTPEQRKAYDAMGRNLEQMRILVNDLRDAARQHAGQFKIRRVPCDVTALVEDIAADYSARAERAGIGFRLDRPDQLGGALDPHRIRQALGNLLDNALRYASPDGDVRLIVDDKGENVEFRVEDDGLGLSAEQKSRLFAPFVQVHEGERKRQGSGLGLFICKGIAEGHGGRIWVESAGVGKGSSFHVLIPREGLVSAESVDKVG